jgi:hypothetical protein
MLAALLAVSTLIFVIVFIAGQRNPDDIRPDLATLSKAELAAMIVVNPSRHDARAQLALLDLREGNAPAALQNMLLLAWAKWDMKTLELELESQLRKDSSQAEACLTLLDDQRRNWLWPREMAVMIGTVANKAGHVLDNLPPLLIQNPEHPLAIKALAEFQNSNLATAWDIAVLVGLKYPGQIINAIVSLPQEEQAEITAVISANYHDHLLVRLLNAHLSGGSVGLDSLLALEDEGLEPWDLRQYSRIKLSLIFQANPETITDSHIRNLEFSETITRVNAVQSNSAPEQSLALNILLAMEERGHQPRNISEYSSIKYQLLQAVVPREAHHLTVGPEFFLHVQPDHLLYLIENWMEKLSWAGYDEHGQITAINMAASLLSAEPGWSHIMSVVNPPPPPLFHSSLDSETRKDQGQIYQLSLSPDGQQIMYFTAKTIWWYDLVDKEYRQVQTIPQAGDYFVHWAPDSRTVVLERRHPELGNSIQFFSSSHVGFISELYIQQATVLGWQDNNTLLISVELSEGYRVSRVYQETSLIQAVSSLPHRPVISPSGKIAWSEISDDVLTINIQGVETKHFLPQANLAIVNWLPGDRGVILQSNSGEYFALNFATGKHKAFDVKGSFTPYAPGWRTDNKILGTFSLGLLNHVMLLDLEDMSLTHTGILSYYGNFSDSNHYWHIHSGTIYIYRLQ